MKPFFFYRLFNGKVTKYDPSKACPLKQDLQDASSFENRKIDRTEITKDCFVSTVFLLVDHRAGTPERTNDTGGPILFETIMFSTKYHGTTFRGGIGQLLRLCEKVKFQ